MATEMPQDDRGGAHVLASVLTLSTLLCAGCMFTPARYRVPQREYPASVERLAVSGFGQRVFEQTEGASSYVGGQYVAGGSNSWAGQYHDVSEAGVFRGKLENTRCVARVEEGNSDSPLRIEGRNGYTGRSAVYTTLAVVEILTLTPFLGVPLANAQGAWAEARLYRDGRFVKEYATSGRVTYLTTIYTAATDSSMAMAKARNRAMQDLADNVAADLCRE